MALYRSHPPSSGISTVSIHDEAYMLRYGAEREDVEEYSGEEGMDTVQYCR